MFQLSPPLSIAVVTPDLLCPAGNGAALANAAANAAAAGNGAAAANAAANAAAAGNAAAANAAAIAAAVGGK